MEYLGHPKVVAAAAKYLKHKGYELYVAPDAQFDIFAIYRDHEDDVPMIVAIDVNHRKSQLEFEDDIFNFLISKSGQKLIAIYDIPTLNIRYDVIEVCMTGDERALIIHTVDAINDGLKEVENE